MSDLPGGDRSPVPAWGETAGVDVVCRGLTVDYEPGDTKVRALDAVDVAFEAGCATALLGPTGSGKSTLLQAIRGLVETASGSMCLDGVDRGDDTYRARLREIGLVFQMPEMQLFAASAREDVAFGPRRLGWSDADVDDAVGRALSAVGLPGERYGDRHPHALSGGEQRRLALAGVLAMRPRLLLLDEPFVSLDPGARRELAGVLETLHAGGMGIVLATHDVDLAWRLCGRRVVLSGGRVEASGPWAFDDGGLDVLRANRLRAPTLVELWRRLGRRLDQAPRTVDEAAEGLA